MHAHLKQSLQSMNTRAISARIRCLSSDYSLPESEAPRPERIQAKVVGDTDGAEDAVCDDDDEGKDKEGMGIDKGDADEGACCWCSSKTRCKLAAIACNKSIDCRPIQTHTKSDELAEC
jgi:hypothetical protein